MKLPGLKSEKVILGNTYQDCVTKFIGVAIGKTTWITGCDTVGLMPEAKDEKVNDSQWFDCVRLIELNPENKEPIQKTKKDLGGPQLIPKQTLKKGN